MSRVGRIGMNRSPASAGYQPHHPGTTKKIKICWNYHRVGNRIASIGVAIDRLYILVSLYDSFPSHHPRFPVFQFHLSFFSFAICLLIKYLLFLTPSRVAKVLPSFFSFSSLCLPKIFASKCLLSLHSYKSIGVSLPLAENGQLLAPICRSACLS